MIRARFWLEILEAVRDAVEADCAVATRIAVDALGPAGIHVEEALNSSSWLTTSSTSGT